MSERLKELISLLVFNGASILVENLPLVWDKYAIIHDRLMAIPLFRDNIGNTSLSALVPCPGGLVHDGGTGTGYWLKSILERTGARKIIATDFSSKMLERAKRKVAKINKEDRERIELRQLDLTKDWPEELFDLQYFQLLANYLPNQGWRRLIEISAKTTKPGGYICSSTLLKGLHIKELAKEHTLEQIRHTPISSFPAALLAGRVMSVFDRLTERGDIIPPERDEYLDFHQKVGFENIEVMGEIAWGAGIVVRARKS